VRHGRRVNIRRLFRHPSELSCGGIGLVLYVRGSDGVYH
jgi:hypothetical protein